VIAKRSGGLVGRQEADVLKADVERGSVLKCRAAVEAQA